MPTGDGINTRRELMFLNLIIKMKNINPVHYMRGNSTPGPFSAHLGLLGPTFSGPTLYLIFYLVIIKKYLKLNHTFLLLSTINFYPWITLSPQNPIYEKKIFYSGI